MSRNSEVVSGFGMYTIDCSGNGSVSETNSAKVEIYDGIVYVTINGVTMKYAGTRCRVSNGRVEIDGIEQKHAGASFGNRCWSKVKLAVYVGVPVFVLWKLWKGW